MGKKPKTNKRNQKVTSRGDKPKRVKKSGEPTKIKPVTLPPPRPTRHNRKSVDYLKLNDGLDEPVTESPKQKRHKPYSPPPRAGPSVTRQAAHKRKVCHDNSEEMKLPDLVINTKSPDAFNGGTRINPLRRSARRQTVAQVESSQNHPVTEHARIDTRIRNNLTALNVPSEPTNVAAQQIVEPTGHDTCTTTDEEDTIEALLSLGDLPDTINTTNVQNDNDQLMPIGKFNTVVDINPVEIKLGTGDVAKAIANMPADQRFHPSVANTDVDVSPVAENPNADDTGPKSKTDQRLDTTTPPPSQKKDDTTDNSVPDATSPNKGKLKVTKYGLRKSHHKSRSYKCQNCGKREKSVWELNNHHRRAHPPLLCSDCNQIFYVPSTYQLHLYEHQKDKKFTCETCGKKFSFLGQLDQHKIVHQSIKTHKCMAKDCNRWFMCKADLKVHTDTHDKQEYTCEHCDSFKTYLKKSWKEHMKGHDDILPYACSICKKRFLYRQQVSRHKAKDHK